MGFFSEKEEVQLSKPQKRKKIRDKSSWKKWYARSSVKFNLNFFQKLRLRAPLSPDKHHHQWHCCYSWSCDYTLGSSWVGLGNGRVGGKIPRLHDHCCYNSDLITILLLIVSILDEQSGGFAGLTTGRHDLRLRRSNPLIHSRNRTHAYIHVPSHTKIYRHK